MTELSATRQVGFLDPLSDGTHQIRTRHMLIIVSALFASLLVAAIVVPIRGAVVGTGHVTPETQVRQISHPEGGIVEAVLVQNGTRVRAGQLLVRLEDDVSATSAELASLSVDQLLAQRALLLAERAGSPTMEPPPEFLTATPAAMQAFEEQRRLFAIRQSEQSRLIAQLNARIQQFAMEIQSLRVQIRALKRQQELLLPEREGIRKLWEKGLVTINRYNQLERTSVDIEGNIAALEANIAQIQVKITETRQQIIQQQESRRAEAGSKLAQIDAALNQERVREVSTGQTQNRSLVRATHDGVVDRLSTGGAGDVIKPGQVLMEIIPTNDKLVVEAAVSPADIDQVHQGLKARVRFSAFNMASTPEMQGKVIFVAPERTSDERSLSSYYMVRVEVNDARAQRLQLRPGMPAEIFIETGSRSMLSYMTKPLRDQLERSFRDN